MCVLFSPLPAAQLHPSVQRAPASARLRAEQVIFWVEVVGDPQGHFSRDQAVHVPVNRHAVNVTPRVDIAQDLGEGKYVIRLTIPNFLIPPVFHILVIMTLV